MKAAEVYRLLATELGPALSRHGFKKLRGSRLALQRAGRDSYQTVWFQCDKRGWDPHVGSRFFANFTVSPSPAFDTLSRHDERLFFFLTEAELAGARDFRDSVVARIPRPPASYFEMFQAECDKRDPESAAGLMTAVRAQFEPEPTPYRRHQDVGMRYWLPSDVIWWARLMRRSFPERSSRWTRGRPSWLRRRDRGQRVTVNSSSSARATAAARRARSAASTFPPDRYRRRAAPLRSQAR